jgi:uncharacterized membrane protein (UPF0127 family)
MAEDARTALPRAPVVRALAALVMAAVIAGCARDPQTVIDAPDGARRAALRVELALTPAKRELGLMYRNHMDEDAGMLFVFPTAGRLRFWMKNTEIPLDMIFADPAGKIIGIVANAEPYSKQSVGPDADAQYVLEVNGGFCARHRVQVGDRMRFVGFEPRAAD